VTNVQQQRWRCNSPWVWLEEIKLWSKKSSSLSEFPHSKQASSQLLTSCCCSVLVSINYIKHLNSGVSETKQLGQLQNCLGPPLGSGSGLSDSSKTLCFRISTRWSRAELLILSVQQLEEIFSNFPDMNLRAWINVLSLGRKRLKCENSGKT